MEGIFLIRIKSIFCILAIAFFSFLSNPVFGQTTIASEDFENALTLFSVTSGSATYYSGTSGGSDGPASSAYSTSNTYGLGISNGTLGVTSSAITTTGYSSISMSFRLGSFSLGSAGNGADAGDIVTVEVSPDGGTTYYSTLRVLGNSNAYWSYAGGTGNATTAYDGDVSSVDYQPSSGGSRTTDGYSTVTITSLPAVASLKVRITLLNNSANERWVIDNFSLIGTASCTPPGTQANTISFSSVTNTGTTVTWVRGNGTAGVIVVAKATSAVDSDPVSGTTYTANTAMGSGTQIGTGNYVVYKGTGTSVAVTGLSSGTTYYYAVYEYNTTGLCVLTPALTGHQLTTGAGSTTATDYFRSLATGNWNTAVTWQSSPDNSTWITATLVPTSSATLITVQTGHTVTINTTATASSIVIAGTGKLTFDGVAARDITVTGDITISAAGGSFITQTSGTYTNTMSIAGNISNAGTFDMSQGGTTLVCTVTFNKNGNQTISGAGATTRFSYVGLNMGTSNSNILEITSSNFQACANFLHPSSGSANLLVNGTIKFSGSYTLTNALFQAGTYYEIVATAGVWVNNSNVTISAATDSYDLYGLLQVTAGTFNVGTASGNSIRYFAGSVMTVDGGTVSIAGRLYCNSIGQTTTFTFSSGTITVCTQGSNTSSSKFAGFQMTAGSTFVWSGGTLVLQQGQSFYGGMDYSDASTHATITGGTLQIANASSGGGINQFYVYSVNSIPNLNITTTNSPQVFLFNTTTVLGNITIASGATLDAQADPNAYAYEVANPGTTIYIATAAYDISLAGNWSNSGTFTNRSKTVTFNGTSAQTLGGSATTTFYNLILNNTAGVTFGINTTVANAGTFTLTAGYHDLATYTLQIGTTAATTLTYTAGGLYSSTNNGSLKRYIPIGAVTSTSSNYYGLFPFKKSASNINVMELNSTSNVTTAGFITATPGFANTVLNVVDYADDHGTVQAIKSGRPIAVALTTIAGGVFTIKVTQGNYGAGVLSDYTLVTYTGASTGYQTTFATTTGTTTLPVVSRTNVNTANLAQTWGVGTYTYSVTALPISLSSFYGVKKGDDNEFFWVTETESDNAYFTLEKMLENKGFSVVGIVNGSLNSLSELTYSLLDQKVEKCQNYYRLKQTDINGNHTYTDLIEIDNREISKEISSKINLLGQEVDDSYRGVIIILYSDGTSLKVIQ